MLEVVHSAEKPLTKEQKRAFSKEASQILREVIGTPAGRLRLYFVDVPWENCIEGIEAEEGARGDSG